MTFDATVNPVGYEGGEAVFIDTEYDAMRVSLLIVNQPEIKRLSYKIGIKIYSRKHSLVAA